MTCCWIDRHTPIFVDYDDIVILIHNRKRQRNSLNILFDIRQIDAYYISCFSKSLALPCSPLMVNPILTRFCFVSSLADKLQYPLKNTFSFDCSHSFGTVNVNALIVIYLCNKKGDSFAVTLMIKRALFYFYSPMHGIFNITPLNSC